MRKFFKLTMSNGTTYVVISRGWSGLCDLVAVINDKDATISPMSLFDFIKYIMRLRK